MEAVYAAVSVSTAVGVAATLGVAAILAVAVVTAVGVGVVAAGGHKVCTPISPLCQDLWTYHTNHSGSLSFFC